MSHRAEKDYQTLNTGPIDESFTVKCVAVAKYSASTTQIVQKTSFKVIGRIFLPQENMIYSVSQKRTTSTPSRR